MKGPRLQSFRLQNFKAVRDSGTIRFTPLTVFIGNNGSGKSSLIEGMETLQLIVEDGLDGAMREWHGFEHIWHQSSPHTLKSTKQDRQHQTNPMSFSLRARTEGKSKSVSAKLEVSSGPGGNELFILKEEITFAKWWKYTRNASGTIKAQPPQTVGYDQAITPEGDPFFNKQPDEKGILIGLDKFSDDDSLMEDVLAQSISEWQFISLIPQQMGGPVPQKRTGGDIQLEKNGSNIAEYLLDIRNKDPRAFQGIIETLHYVLPYATDLQPALTSELERTVYLQMTEGKFKLPGWLLSTGTLRILAILALLRHPSPPPVIIIEEIENGLDPRTINLIVDEIRNAVESGKTQVILTTHSPYLLDLLLLSHIVLAERVDDQPVFTRPADIESLKEWTKKFRPGQLYTMDLLSGKSDK